MMIDNIVNIIYVKMYIYNIMINIEWEIGKFVFSFDINNYYYLIKY